MTHIEKMKQWLEALKVVNSCIDDYYLPKEKAWLPEIEQAITSLRQAIAEAEAEKHEPVACEKCGKAIKDGKVKCVQGRNCWVGQQPAQRTEQEPQSVRERWNIERDGDDLLVCFNDHDKSQACTYTRYVPSSQRTEQEPVAWQDTAKHDELVAAEDWDNIDPQWHWMYRPLYTTPQQRKPLTDEQLRVIENTINPNMRWRSSDEEGITLYPSEYYDLVRSIEAAHGIKE